jgi:hypothetical protein
MAKQPHADLRLALETPFPPETVKWRLGSTFQQGGTTKGVALAYIDARHVMDRLDSVVGVHNWMSAIAESPSGRVLCTLSINIDGQWISKTDGAGSTQVEGDKGGISDALKRAAVQWGIGRYLYAMGNSYVQVEGEGKFKKIPAHEYKRLARAIRLQFEGKYAEMAAELETNVEDGDTAPAKTAAAAPTEKANDEPSVGNQLDKLARSWLAAIKDSGVVDDLKAIHTAMNEQRQAFAAMGPDYVAKFKKVVNALSDRKDAILENDARKEAE